MYKLNYKGTDIVVISDTHCRHRELTVPPCDLLIHLGDVCNFGSQSMADFFEWYAKQEAETKILITGNHDAEFAKRLAAFSELVPEGIALLNNCKTAIRCMKDGAREISLTTVLVQLKEIGKEWVDLEDVDILLTHSLFIRYGYYE